MAPNSLYQLILCVQLLSVIPNGFAKTAEDHLDDEIRNYHKEKQPEDSGFNEYTVTHLAERGIGTSNIPFVSASIHRRKRSLEETKNKLTVEFKAFDETFTLDVHHQKSTIHPNAKIVITNGDKEVEWTGPHPDCFLTGNVTSHKTGTVSLSYCDDLEGGMWTDDHEYHIMTLPERLHKRDTSTGIIHSVLIARKTLGTSPNDWLHLQRDTIEVEDDLSDKTTVLKDSDNTKFREDLSGKTKLQEDASDEELQSRAKRQTTYAIPSTSFTIELAVYTDSNFTSIFTYTDVTRRIVALAAKYNGVQAEWGRSGDLGYTVTIEIKYINMFETDPIWYNVTTVLGSLLSQICLGAATGAHDPYDHVFLHTGVPGANLGGLAYQNKMCRNNTKCGVSASRSLVTYIATAHEIGHNLGMYHDADRNCIGSNIGVMGGRGVGWSTCSKADMQTYLETGNAHCLWETNIPLGNVPANIQSISLTGELIGQTMLQDEVCEILYGSGFRFREYPNFDNCGLFTCVDMNRGNTYGQMYKVTSGISGNYCGAGMVCFKGSCSTLATAELTGATVTTGGWSNWGSWTTCSRTCGTGILHRRRICNNPRPKNAAYCSGDEYEAELCNTTPCLGDSVTESTLITERASETCYALVQHGIIDTNNYFPSGTIYNSVRMGKCEVKCDKRSGYTAEAYTRYGLMPDGTPCNEALHTWDENDWPRRPGYEDYCLEGYCYIFGCDNKLNGQEYDQCGVCGGDNSTCLFYNSVFTDSVAQGDRVTIVQLPAGSFNVQFWFTYSQMKNNYVELWSKYDRAIIASRVGYSWVYDTASSPIYHAGAYWSFYFNTQYLLGKGVLTDSVTIKYSCHTGNPNLGVNYAYSTPLDVGSCTGSCQNGGTWDSSLCACICPADFYSLDCSSSCSTQCLNGGTVIESGCGCQCNNQSFGATCQTCKAPYTGQACQSCVSATCQNCGLFDSATCRCQCLDGYGGASCDIVCADSLATCAADAAAGNCDTDNINMETNCPLSCGLCVAKTPPDSCSTAVVVSTTTTTTQTTTTQSSSSCGANEFSCNNGNCVSVNVTCDRIDDCGDYSDELGTCMSSTVESTSTSTTSTISSTLSQTSTTTTTSTSTRSTTSLKPTTTTGSTTSLKPTTSTESTTSLKPTTTTGSTTSLKPTTSTESTTSLKPTTSTESATTTQPTTSTGSTSATSTKSVTTSGVPPTTQSVSSTTMTRPTGHTPLSTEEIFIIGGTVAGISIMILVASGYALYVNKSTGGVSQGTQQPHSIQSHRGDDFHELISHQTNDNWRKYSSGSSESSIYSAYSTSEDVFKNYNYVYKGKRW